MGFRFPLTRGGSGKYGSMFPTESKLGCYDNPPPLPPTATTYTEMSGNSAIISASLAFWGITFR